MPVALPSTAGRGDARTLVERVAALELSVGKPGTGGLALQIQALEEAIWQETQSGALAARVCALETAVMGDNN